MGASEEAVAADHVMHDPQVPAGVGRDVARLFAAGAWPRSRTPSALAHRFGTVRGSGTWA